MTLRPMLLVAMLAATAAVRAQDPDPQSAIQLDLRIGGTPYAVSARGTCLAQPHGSLYDVPAAQWSARHRDDQRYVNLAFWRVSKVGEMFNLGVLVGTTMHRVSTVKVQGKGDPHGAGRVTLTPNGAGGSFSIDATADTGARITGTITCGAFARPVEDNG
jgi:hypothetical protein